MKLVFFQYFSYLDEKIEPLPGISQDLLRLSISMSFRQSYDWSVKESGDGSGHVSRLGTSGIKLSELVHFTVQNVTFYVTIFCKNMNYSVICFDIRRNARLLKTS